LALTQNDIPPGPAAIVASGSIVGKVPGDRRRKRIRITADTNYLTGGYQLTPAMFGFSTQIDYVDISNDGCGAPGAVANLSWFYNTVTQKMQLIVVSTGAELGNGQTAAGCTADIVGEGF
jgi:hypothetical protein